MSAQTATKTSTKIFGVLSDIAFDVVNDIEGVEAVNLRGIRGKNRGIHILQRNNGKIEINVKIKVHEKYNIPNVAVQIQENIKKQIEETTKFEVYKTNVIVVSALVVD